MYVVLNFIYKLINKWLFQIFNCMLVTNVRFSMVTNFLVTNVLVTNVLVTNVLVTNVLVTNVLVT